MASMTPEIELVDRILSRNLDWISAADSKVAPILAIDTAMLGVLAALVPSAESWRALPAVLAAISALLLCGSVVSLIAATFPRLSGPKASMVFFGGISSFEREQYVAQLLGAHSADVTRDIAQQCHRNAEIAATKYWCVKWAMILLFGALPFWVAAVSLLYSGRAPNAC